MSRTPWGAAPPVAAVLLAAGILAMHPACAPPDPSALHRSAAAIREGMTEAEVRAACAGAWADLVPSAPNTTLRDGRRVRLVLYNFGLKVGRIEVAYDREGKAVAAWMTDSTRGGTPPRLLFDTGTS